MIPLIPTQTAGDKAKAQLARILQQVIAGHTTIWPLFHPQKPHVYTVDEKVGERAITDPETGEPVLDGNGEPVIEDIIAPVEHTDMIPDPEASQAAFDSLGSLGVSTTYAHALLTTTANVIARLLDPSPLDPANPVDTEILQYLGASLAVRDAGLVAPIDNRVLGYQLIPDMQTGQIQVVSD